MPIGTVIAWPSATLPPASNGVVPLQGSCVAAASDEQAKALGCEWLEADGSSLHPAAYPDLAAIFGTTLPDYRGVFLRGHGAAASAHYGAVTHQSGHLGELQGDAVRNITGTVGRWNDNRGTGYSGSMYLISYGAMGGHAQGGGYGWDIGIDASRVVPVANENRPINKAVKYVVRVR